MHIQHKFIPCFVFSHPDVYPHLDVPLTEQHFNNFLHDREQTGMMHGQAPSHQVSEPEDLHSFDCRGGGMTRSRKKKERGEEALGGGILMPHPIFIPGAASCPHP